MKKVCLVVCALLLASGVQASMTTTLGSDADTWVRDGYAAQGGSGLMNILGVYGFSGYLRFDLSSLGAADITAASLTLTKVAGGSRNDTLTTGRFALHGMNNVAGNTAQDWDESTLTWGATGDEFTGDSVMAASIADGRVVNLDGDDAGINVTEAVTAGSTVMTVSGADLVAFLQNRLNDGGLATFVITLGSAEGRGYALGTKENAAAEYQPSLQLTYIPEPATMVLLGLGGLLAARRKRQPI